MKKLFFLFCGVLFFAMTASFYAAFEVTRYAYAPGRQNAELQTVVVAPGQGFSATTHRLAEGGIIENPLHFRIFARINGYDKQIKAGEYEVSASLSPARILEMLISGKVVLHRLTVPEGLTYHQIAGLAAGAGFFPAETFIRAAEDATLTRELGVTGTSFEGYLFPDTYYFPRGTTARDMIIAMANRFKNIFTPEWQERAAELKMSLHEVTTLASIIEKETGASVERPLISSVFHNRLKRGMRLETDPTVIYGITEFNGNITREHLQADTPYNTYRITGLPPGPIANPGKEALYAALYPEETDYLFFVSKNNGTHQFSTSMAAHDEAVRKYQLGK
ncbi:MAG: endolytic transglycosylase MltG [Pseudomonadota bacterium]